MVTRMTNARTISASPPDLLRFIVALLLSYINEKNGFPFAIYKEFYVENNTYNIIISLIVYYRHPNPTYRIPPPSDQGREIQELPLLDCKSFPTVLWT